MTWHKIECFLLFFNVDYLNIHVHIGINNDAMIKNYVFLYFVVCMCFTLYKGLGLINNKMKMHNKDP